MIKKLILFLALGGCINLYAAELHEMGIVIGYERRFNGEKVLLFGSDGRARLAYHFHLEQKDPDTPGNVIQTCQTIPTCLIDENPQRAYFTKVAESAVRDRNAQNRDKWALALIVPDSKTGTARLMQRGWAAAVPFGRTIAAPVDESKQPAR